jgi:membrane-associated phospholipid phosphatase
MFRTIVRATAASLMLLISASANGASIVTEWLDDVLPYAKEVAWEPTVGARFLAIVHTAMYDAWTAYDPAAVGCVTGTVLKGQGGLDNEANKREAISHAAFTVLRTLAPQHKRALIERMRALGYDPDADTPPAKVGRRAARAVLAVRREDGSNEADDFADTTGYAPRKSGADRWQPIADFGKRQLPTTPHWGRVMPFALTSLDQFHPVPPPAPESAEWSQQIDVLIRTSGTLTDAQKAAAEYWGIWGMAPPPQLFELTKFVSNSNDLRLDDDVKLFFVVSNAILDASIATWKSKYVYDYVRPITAIQALGATTIKAWRPRSLPVAFAYSTPLTRSSSVDNPVTIPAAIGEIRAADWVPYLPTPSFPAYVSGHSAFTAAWARVMELATGHPDLNFRKAVRHLYVEQRELAEPVTLDYPTFASAAQASGMSRIWAGIHWPADNEMGLELGRKIGENVWQRGQQFVLGTASPATAVFLALRPPYWFYDNLTADHPAQFRSSGGLAMDISAGGAGAWRSIVVDAVPAGSYQLKLVVAATGDRPLRLAAAIEASQGGGAVLGKTETILQPAGTPDTITIPWQSDGAHAFRVSIEAHADSGSAKLLVSSVSARRIWPMAAGGSRRYYEMSTAGLPDH